MSFASDLKRFEQQTNTKVTAARRKMVLDLFMSVINATPVDTGRAQGNWQTAVGAAAEGTADRLGGEKAISEVSTVLATLTDDETVHLTNNLPYIIPLENGSSEQAPAGMVRTNVRRFQTIAQKAAAEVRRGVTRGRSQ